MKNMKKRRFCKKAVLVSVWAFFSGSVFMVHAAASDDKWDKAGQEVMEAAGAVTEATKDTSKKAWQKTKEGSVELYEKASEESGEIWDQTKEISSETWDSVKEGSEDAWESSKEESREVFEPGICSRFLRSATPR